MLVNSCPIPQMHIPPAGTHIHPGVCGLYPGNVPYGASERERGKADRENKCALKMRFGSADGNSSQTFAASR